MLTQFGKKIQALTTNTVNKEVVPDQYTPSKDDVTPPPVSPLAQFLHEAVSKQRTMLRDNLEKLDVPADEQEKIIKMRAQLPDNYHDMPREKPSRCFWLFENMSFPEKTWKTQHKIKEFERCGHKIRESAKNIEDKPSTDLKF